MSENTCAWCGTATNDSALCEPCLTAWPKCAIPACLNKSCLRLKSIYCWPHTPGQRLEQDDLDLLEEDEGEDCNVEDSYAR